MMVVVISVKLAFDLAVEQVIELIIYFTFEFAINLTTDLR
jgi:hypothetical protein